MRSIIVVDGTKTFDIARCRIVSTSDDPEEAAVGTILFEGPLRDTLHDLYRRHCRLYNLLASLMNYYADSIPSERLRKDIEKALQEEQDARDA